MNLDSLPVSFPWFGYFSRNHCCLSFNGQKRKEKHVGHKLFRNGTHQFYLCYDEFQKKALQCMAWAIQKKAKFDIVDLNNLIFVETLFLWL
ncbi:unnamed protein product [Linum tenue]|uniref:Uncharacterized protein n=1 Tax=Linum tenue TaxID=586396 RepID=A0AAV0HJ56_9ROSI|nr:unnamed protein product [Linum tenue]